MNEHAPQVSEAEVLSEAARTLRELGDRLPSSSKWADMFSGVAEGFEAAAQLSQMRDRRAA